MQLNEFKEFVMNNENYKFRSNTLRSIANAVIEIMNKNEELSYKNISRKTGIKYITVYQAINRFKPYEKQIYPQSTLEQIESSLGEAYATGIRGLAKNFNWLGEVITEIGLTAFLGFLMSMHVSPEETEEFLKKFEDPKEVVNSFKDYFTYLLRFSSGAYEVQKISEELKTYREENRYLKEENLRLGQENREQRELIELLSATLNPEQRKKVLKAYLILHYPSNNSILTPLVHVEAINALRPEQDIDKLTELVMLYKIVDKTQKQQEIMPLKQEIQDLKEKINIEGEIRNLGQKLDLLTQDFQYIKAKLNAMEKVDYFKQELNELKEKKAVVLN